MGIERAEVLQRMRAAFKQKMSASRFLAQMRTEGLSYRRTTMLSDWRSVNKLMRVEGALQYVRKGYMPSPLVVAAVTWDISKEYMYVLKVKTRLGVGEPITERKVNIVTDRPLTPREMEQQVTERWGEWEKYEGQELVGIKAWTAVRKVME